MQPIKLVNNGIINVAEFEKILAETETKGATQRIVTTNFNAIKKFRDSGFSFRVIAESIAKYMEVNLTESGFRKAFHKAAKAKTQAAEIRAEKQEKIVETIATPVEEAPTPQPAEAVSETVAHDDTFETSPRHIETDNYQFDEFDDADDLVDEEPSFDGSAYILTDKNGNKGFKWNENKYALFKAKEILVEGVVNQRSMYSQAQRDEAQNLYIYIKELENGL